MTAPVRFQPYSRTTRRAVTLILLAFVVLLSFGLAEAHCDPLKPAALYLSLSAADLGSTYVAERSIGVTEGNRWMGGHRLEKQLLVAAALTAADMRLQRTGHVRKLRAIVVVIRVVAVAINVNNIRRAR